MNLRQAAQQALEAMIEHGSPYLGHESAYQSAITALRAALAEHDRLVGIEAIEKDAGIHVLQQAEPEQEPDGISWLKRDSGYFTAPTPRKPLTYDELEPLCEAFDSYDTTQNELVEFARAIEKAHGITGEQI